MTLNLAVSRSRPPIPYRVNLFDFIMMMHRLHATVHRCGLLLQMSYVAWSVGLSVGVLCTRSHG